MENLNDHFPKQGTKGWHFMSAEILRKQQPWEMDRWMGGWPQGTFLFIDLFNMFLLTATRLGCRGEQFRSSLIMEFTVHQGRDSGLKISKMSNMSPRECNQNELHNLTWLLSAVTYMPGKMRKCQEPLLERLWRPNRFWPWPSPVNTFLYVPNSRVNQEVSQSQVSQQKPINITQPDKTVLMLVLLPFCLFGFF